MKDPEKQKKYVQKRTNEWKNEVVLWKTLNWSHLWTIVRSAFSILIDKKIKPSSEEAQKKDQMVIFYYCGRDFRPS